MFCEFSFFFCVKTIESQQHWGGIEVGRLEKYSSFDRSDILFFQEIYSKYVTPLQPIAKEPQPYVSKHTVSQPLSPYYLSNNDSRKNFMSGKCSSVGKDVLKLTNRSISFNMGIKIIYMKCWLKK